MHDHDGLTLAAVLIATSFGALALACLVRRDWVRRPAAWLSILACAPGAYLLVRHAPAGPVWEPPTWVVEELARRGVMLRAPLRQGGLPEGRAGSAGRSGQIGGGGGSGPLEDDADTAVATTRAGDDDQGTAGRLMSALLGGDNRRRAAVAGDRERDCPHCPLMVVVPAGTLRLGPGDGYPAWREVRFWPGFAISRYEVSVAEYGVFAQRTGRSVPACAASTAATEPITCVSAADAAAYTAWLRRITGKPYRLATADEWEYAARAGGSTPVMATGSELQPVAAAAANAWGISGMGGNVAEMTADCWPDTLADLSGDGLACRAHVVKDAAWSEPGEHSKPGIRRRLEWGAAAPTIGLRLARDLR